MTTENWTELTSAYGATFIPKIAPERNVLAAVVDLYATATTAAEDAVTLADRVTSSENEISVHDDRLDVLEATSSYYGEYADELTALAESGLPVGGLFTIVGSNIIYRKPTP